MHDYIPNDLNYVELLAFFSPKILIAIICGGIVGLERELKHKAAGIKTNMLICAGAALYTGLSLHISQMFAGSHYQGDPGRIAAQIVSGIGFLGGGAIIQSRGTVVGLTTAATIWVVAAIGICVGLGYYSMGVSSTILVVAVLIAVTWFEDHILGRRSHFSCEVVVSEGGAKLRQTVTHLLGRFGLQLDDLSVHQKGTEATLVLEYSGSSTEHKQFVLALWETDGIKEVRQR